jgi:hypothetical protein
VDILFFIFTFIILFVIFALWAVAYDELSALNVVGHPAKQKQLPVCNDWSSEEDRRKQWSVVCEWLST